MSLQVRPCRPGKPSFALSDMIQSLIGTRSFFLAEVFPHIMHQMDVFLVEMAAYGKSCICGTHNLICLQSWN